MKQATQVIGSETIFDATSYGYTAVRAVVEVGASYHCVRLDIVEGSGLHIQHSSRGHAEVPAFRDDIRRGIRDTDLHVVERGRNRRWIDTADELTRNQRAAVKAAIPALCDAASASAHVRLRLVARFGLEGKA